MPNEKCPDCKRTEGHEPGCFQTGGDPEAIRQLMAGWLGKRCGLWVGPDGVRITIYLTDEEAEVVRAARG
ncbi:MAG TPA: hypothetical protein VJQ57_09235 [Acidimicrobiia bacterium]|nr:hypothetical protein [Acidimicrobiia bacterium]